MIHGKCSGCIYGRPFKAPQMITGDATKRVCHRYPPHPSVVPMGAQGSQMMFQPPVVEATYGCGEFRPELLGGELKETD